MVKYARALKSGGIFYLFFLLSHIIPVISFANGLTVGNVILTDTSHLKFTISWENSWNLENVKEPGNHDAVWVFVKFRKDNGSWDNLQISKGANTSQYTVSGSQDSAGVFITRATKGSGNNSIDTIELRLGRALSTGDYEFKVFGIEMVWINTGPFYIGDAWSQKSFSRGDTLSSFFVGSEAAIAIGKDSLSLRDTGEYDPKVTIPYSFPKGYQGFYCMKYEITQGEYVDFLNCLSYAQQKNRTINSPNVSKGAGAFVSGLANRNGIIISESGIAPDVRAIYACNADKDASLDADDDGSKRACNFLNWADIAAYLDWSALRPMTELEFEKVCRGPSTPVQKEFAWGTAASVDANTLIYDGSDSEGVSDSIPTGAGIASYGYLGPQGPLRAGFAAGENTGRLRSGAAYYGAMEMSGNLWETCVNISATGLLFDGRNGDGVIDAAGNANTQNWPGADGNGAGYRGGAWLSGVVGEFRDPAISARFYAELKPDLRRNTSGGRGVR